ncbi:MAG: hypothetical protein Q8P42_11515 [Gallionella sp.]|nr:hypothetical protein [Gallionella sp.]
MTLRNPRRRTGGEGDAVMLLQLVGHPAKGGIGPKIRDRPLQRPRITPAADLRRLDERASEFSIALSEIALFRAYPVVTPSQKRWLFYDRKWDDTPDFGIMKAIR